MMTLRQIRHFIAVAETGSISAAAQTAFISQSTLTLAIQQLEQEIGVNLFNRHAKGMTLTHQGHQFLRQAHLILATVDNAKRSLQQSTDQVAGQLTIGVTSLVAGYYLADLLTRFQRAYPNVEIRVMEDERPYIEHLLVSGEIDVGVLILSTWKTATPCRPKSLPIRPTVCGYRRNIHCWNTTVSTWPMWRVSR